MFRDELQAYELKRAMSEDGVGYGEWTWSLGRGADGKSCYDLLRLTEVGVQKPQSS